jgi:DNA-binding ferritin-like protein (Dps family)
MNILAVKRKKNKWSLAAVAPAPDDQNVGGRLRWRNAKKRIEAIPKEARKAMAIMDMTMFDSTASNDLDKLKVEMRSYRQFLPMAEKKEFDGMCRTTRM